MKSEKGFSLVETIIALALLGIVAVAFLGGLSTASKVIFTADERATAESLARTQMEYVRNQPYSSASWDYTVTSSPPPNSTDPPSWYDASKPNPPLLSSDYAGYTVIVNVVLLHSTDDGIQKVIVLVYHPYDAAHPDDYVVKLEGYRSLR
jgi:prepilin-type N-terminal cleavage/methylation domain-containing protein